MHESRTFRVEEANRALPLVRAITADIVRARRALDEASAEYERLRARPDRSEPTVLSLAELAARRAGLAAEIDALAAELRELGCRLEDPATGTVDFPSEVDGQPVALCWRAGEEQVEFWHEVSGGSDARKPLPVTVPED